MTFLYIEKILLGLKNFLNKYFFTGFVFFLFFSLNNYCYSHELYFFIGAAFTQPAKIIASSYKSSKVHVVSGGSGRMLNEIIFSKKGDIFLPGDDFYTEKLAKKNLILKSKKFLIKIPVMGISENGRKKIKDFNDLFKKNIKIASGNPRTMALGRIFLKIKPAIPEIGKNIIINAINISQIVNYLKLNIVDAGILFDSVARENKIYFVKFPEKVNVVPSKSSLSILKYTKNYNEALKFFQFILKNKFIFKRKGFNVL